MKKICSRDCSVSKFLHLQFNPVLQLAISNFIFSFNSLSGDQVNETGVLVCVQYTYNRMPFYFICQILGMELVVKNFLVGVNL